MKTADVKNATESWQLPQGAGEGFPCWFSCKDAAPLRLEDIVRPARRGALPRMGGLAHRDGPELVLGNPSRSMANTSTRTRIQIVFASKGCQNLFCAEHKEELQDYMTGILSARGQKPQAIHGMPDHTHLLVGHEPDLALSELIGAIKTGATNCSNRSRRVVGRFNWQEGFGVCSNSHSQLTRVIRFIQNQ